MVCMRRLLLLCCYSCGGTRLGCSAFAFTAPAALSGQSQSHVNHKASLLREREAARRSSAGFLRSSSSGSRSSRGRSSRSSSGGSRLHIFPVPDGPPAIAPVELLPKATPEQTAVVWFNQGDLRVHDHDALQAAAHAKAVLPVFVFNSEELHRERPLDVSLLYHAVSDLQASLRGLGSDLIVLQADSTAETAQAVQELVSASDASVLYYHYSAVQEVRACQEAVEKLSATADTQVHTWRCQLQGEADVEASKVWNYRDWQALTAGMPLREPFPAPTELPPLPDTEGKGSDLPTLHEVMSTSLRDRPAEVVTFLQGQARGEELLGAKELSEQSAFGEKLMLKWLDKYVSEGDAAFGAYLLNKLEDHAEPHIQLPGDKPSAEPLLGLDSAVTRRIVKARGVGGLARGEVFARSFGAGLSLGCLSPRRVMLARQHGYAPSPLSVARPWTCYGKEVVTTMQWHDILAERDVEASKAAFSQPEEHGPTKGEAAAAAAAAVTSGGAEVGARPPFEVRYWKWHGWGCRYAVGGSTDPEAPALLMVHGFGASVDQWQGCFERLGTRFRLFAVDLIGFGHSSKPPLTYTQYLWCDFVRDFTVNIISSPFYIAGNSIGGYVSMGVAADSFGLCKGVILINSAGRLLDQDEWEQEQERFGPGVSVEDATRMDLLGSYGAPPNFLLYGLSQLLFMGLQGRIAKTCYSLYPTNPGVVDEGLADNIFRDSRDPGAVGIFASGAKLPFSRSANEMLGKFGGPVLVAQGTLDPLNDAVARAEQFKDVHNDVKVVPINGGHCPHEENADEVCAAMVEWIDAVELNGKESASSSSPELANVGGSETSSSAEAPGHK